MPEYRIGISGWTYGPWRGTFYPKGVAQKRELAYASRQVNSIEINGSFYSLQRPSSFQLWHEQTPDDFVFSVKGGRFITHMKRLQNVEAPLANFFASGVLKLKQKLGPILWQLPPMFVYRRDRLESFFDLLPRDTEEAATLARKHDARVNGRAWTETDERRPIRHALEVRHVSFENPEFIDVLRQHRIALVVSDTAGKFPFFEDATADFVYVRLHGDEELYVSGYSDDALTEWARKLKIWRSGRTPSGVRLVGRPGAKESEGRDIYVYFDNDVKVQAPYDAMSLAHKVGVGPKPTNAPDPKTISETARTIWPGMVSRWQFDKTKRGKPLISADAR